MMEAMAGTHVLNKDDHWVAAPRDDLEDYLDEDEELEDDWYNNKARDCIGWEEDMVKNSEFFI